MSQPDDSGSRQYSSMSAAVGYCVAPALVTDVSFAISSATEDAAGVTSTAVVEPASGRAKIFLTRPSSPICTGRPAGTRSGAAPSTIAAPGGGFESTSAVAEAASRNAIVRIKLVE